MTRPAVRRKPQSLRDQALQLGKQAITRKEARDRAARAIRLVCGGDAATALHDGPHLPSFGTTSDRRWRFGRR
jgi:hypothetical protein